MRGEGCLQLHVVGVAEGEGGGGGGRGVEWEAMIEQVWKKGREGGGSARLAGRYSPADAAVAAEGVFCLHERGGQGRRLHSRSSGLGAH